MAGMPHRASTAFISQSKQTEGGDLTPVKTYFSTGLRKYGWKKYYFNASLLQCVQMQIHFLERLDDLDNLTSV